MAGLDVGLTGTATATIMIDDKNDHPPKFTKKEVSVCGPSAPAGRGHGGRSGLIPRTTCSPGAGFQFAKSKRCSVGEGVPFRRGVFSYLYLLCACDAGKRFVRTKALNLVKVCKKRASNAKAPSWWFYRCYLALS